jgi:hypothetical protein
VLSVFDHRPILPDTGSGRLAADLFHPGNFINTATSNVQESLILGAGLVTVVIFLFLFDLRTAAISSVAIPLLLLAGTIVLEETEPIFQHPANQLVRPRSDAVWKGTRVKFPGPTRRIRTHALQQISIGRSRRLREDRFLRLQNCVGKLRFHRLLVQGIVKKRWDAFAFRKA